MTRYNHAMTIAYEAISDDPDGPSVEEAWDGLLKRIQDLMEDPRERFEALMSDAPFDTYEMED